jgi:hypothetical protein
MLLPIAFVLLRTRAKRIGATLAGARSYAIYLLHIPLWRVDVAMRRYHAGWADFAERAPGRHWLLFLLAVIAAAEVSWWGLEWPMQQLGRRLTDGSLSPRRITPGGWVRVGVFAAGCFLLSCQHQIAHASLGTNIALGRPVTASSVDPVQPDAGQLTNGVFEAQRGLHLSGGEKSWAIIDLGSVQPIGSIVTYNRADGWQDAVLPLTVEVSEDGKNYTVVGQRYSLFSQWIPWRVKLHDVKARFVRYTGPDGGYLCLSESEVYPP